MFCAKQGVEIEFPGNDWYHIGDAMISLDMIRVDIDNEAPKGKIFEWYWKWVDQDGYPNYENYLKWNVGALK